MADYAELVSSFISSAYQIEHVFNVFGQVLSDTNIMSILDEVIAAGDIRLLVLLFTGDNGDLETSNTMPISDWVLEQFPTDASEYEVSTTARLLTTLSMFFTFNALLLNHRELSMELGRYHKQVMATIPAIRALTAMHVGVPREGNKSWNTKKHIDFAEDASDDLRSLRDLDIAPPDDPSQVEKCLEEVLGRQRHILRFYLQIFCNQEFKHDVRASVTQGDHDQPSQSVQHTIPCVKEENINTQGIEPNNHVLHPIPLNPHLESIGGFGIWPILMSTRASKHLREARRKDRSIFLSILKKIRDLSHGDFHGDNQRPIQHSNESLPIFEARAQYNARIVYHIDCAVETSKEERQGKYDSSLTTSDTIIPFLVIRIFGIYNASDLDNRMWDAIGKQLYAKGDLYRSRCTSRTKLHGDSRTFIPTTFLPRVSLEDSTSISDLGSDDLELQPILILQKFVPFSKALLYSIYADLDATFPFEVSIEEQCIIEHPFSCYVLGRSGTGKTTTMLHKMLWIEKSFELDCDPISKPRQIFITRSSDLAKKVEEYFSKMMESVGMSAKSPQELKAIAGDRKHKLDKHDLFDHDEDIHWNSHLPSKFSELRAEHFPLFITFDHLCSLLQLDFMQDERVVADVEPIKMTMMEHNFVSFNKFLSEYWTHFDQTLTKGLDPYMVFSEIHGVIQGSERAAQSPQQYLDLGAYESLSMRTNATFSRMRSTIFTLYQSYQKKRREYGHFDAAERTHTLLRKIRELGFPGEKVDYLYVDEAQDNLMIDALLLRCMCSNPHGLFWAGDTAQTIFPGSSFRFQDLKSAVYRMERQSDLLDLHCPLEKGNNSEINKTFLLTTNYRSHSGIVNCARSVVELIQHNWPYSIDILAPERGLHAGPSPIFLDVCDTDSLQYVKYYPPTYKISTLKYSQEQFLFGAKEEALEFGATQCILVRNEAARDELRAKVGDIGIVLTVYESKGLEFNDVLLYNFFSNSNQSETHWRLISSSSPNETTMPRFDEIKHGGLCVELKTLYVAMTRAKKNLWIADCSKTANPMKAYWFDRKLINICAIDEELPKLAETSTPEQWATTGRSLFDRKQYSQAKNCFRRALCPREEAMANAYALRNEAERLPSSSEKRPRLQKHRAYLNAAHAFLHCTSVAVDPTVYFRRAGECFELGEDYLEAAQAYYKGGNFTKVVLVYRKLGMLEEAISVVIENEDKVQPEIAQNIQSTGKLFHLSRVRTDQSALEKSMPLFSSVEEQLEYADDMGLDDARVAILLSTGKNDDAAEFFQSNGRTLDAVNLLMVQTQDKSSMRKAMSYILRGLWKELPFGHSLTDDNPAVAQLMDLGSQINFNCLSLKDIAEFQMFQAIRKDDRSALVQLGGSLWKSQNEAVAVRCFEHIYARYPLLSNHSLQELSESMDHFASYVRSVYTLVFHNDPTASPVVLDLFGIESQGDQFLVPKNTMIDLDQFPGKAIDGQVMVDKVHLLKMLRVALRKHLENLLLKEEELCYRARPMNPCMHYIIYGTCRESECRNEHIHRQQMDKTWFNSRIQIHLSQVSIIQTIAPILSTTIFNDLRWKWIARFYEALHPPFHIIGTEADLDPAVIPKFEEHLKRLKMWVHDLIYKLTYSPLDRFLTNLLRYVSMGLYFDTAEIHTHIYRSRYLTYDRIPDYVRKGDGYIVFDVLSCLQARAHDWDSLTLGILFVKHVVDKFLPIDIGTFCDFLELLCGSLFISKSRRDHRGTIHDILLPRSWWIKLILVPDRSQKKSIQLHWLLIDIFTQLLSQLLDLKAENLLWHSKPVTANGRTTHYWFCVSRLCRMASLYGYNMKTRYLIVNMFKRLSIPNIQIPHTCNLGSYKRRYFQMTSWKGVLPALHHSGFGLQREELLLVWYETIPIPQGAHGERYFRRIFYIDVKQLEDGLIGERMISVVKTTGYTSDRQAEPGDMENADQPPQGMGPGDPMEGDETVTDEKEETFDETIMPAPQMLFDALTEEKEKAGRLILWVYTSYLKRKRPISNNSMQRMHIFTTYLEQSRRMEWPARSQYRFLYRGPLPHLLYCLEKAKMDISAKKNKAKKLLNDLRPENIENANKRLTEISWVDSFFPGVKHIDDISFREKTKMIHFLEKNLKANSDFHQAQDCQALRSLVQKAATFLEESGHVREQWEDLEIAVKGIVKESVVKRKERGELNLSERVLDVMI
ncbi:hypothetical protein AMATHDRAFT_85569, partial [Amanita thiersii Skay4041]